MRKAAAVLLLMEALPSHLFTEIRVGTDEWDPIILIYPEDKEEEVMNWWIDFCSRIPGKLGAWLSTHVHRKAGEPTQVY